MINMTIDALLGFMKKNNYTAEIQQDTQQIYTIFKINKKEYPFFLRIFDNGNLLQLLVFIPSLLKPTPNTDEQEKGIRADLARLLHLLNKELDMPGFGMDEMEGIVFYRLMLPAPKKKIDEELLVAFLKTSEHVCQMFTTPIEAVASGHMTLDEILAKANEMDNK